MVFFCIFSKKPSDIGANSRQNSTRTVSQAAEMIAMINPAMFQSDTETVVRQRCNGGGRGTSRKAEAGGGDSGSGSTV